MKSNQAGYIPGLREYRMIFCKADYVESGEALGNPDCGWYHIYPFVFKEVSGAVFPALDFRLLARSLEENSGERLALVQFHIGFFRDRELSVVILRHMEQILACFRTSGKQIILRVAYDLEGKGLLHEPESEDLIHRHMEQLGLLIRTYASDILTLQGIFVGNWGEMHGSRYLSEPAVARLVLSLYRASGGSCFLAVRTPAQWRNAIVRLAGEPGLEGRLTLFNDGLFGSDTDLGTYGMCGGRKADEAGRRGKNQEVEWQYRTMVGRPVGGEAVAAPAPVGYMRAAAELAKIHACYLNSAYDKKQLDFWRWETVDAPGCWQGISGYDYIGRHLGPRFVIRDAKRVGRKLMVVIENQGFSGVCRETECFLVTEQEDGGQREFRLEANVCTWHSGRTIRLSVPLPSESERPIWLSLTLRGREDGRVIRFANRGADGSVQLGQLRSG